MYMIMWLVTLFLALLFRVWAKTAERKAANALTLAIYDGANKDALTLMSGLIEQPTPVNALQDEVARLFPPFTFLFRFIYALFAFSFTALDTHTPPSFVLYDNEKEFYALRDPDVSNVYYEWKNVFFWDRVSTVPLLVVLLSACSLPVFHFFYR